MVNLTIDGQKLCVEEGTTILKAAKQASINIPTLCWHEDLGIKANCRICVVEVEGMKQLDYGDQLMILNHINRLLKK